MLKRAIAGAIVLTLGGCAAPSTVKQAVKNQSDAYLLLDQSIQDLGTAVRGLAGTLKSADDAARLRICASAVLEGRSATDAAMADCGRVEPVRSALPTTRSASALAEYTDFIGRLDAALRTQAVESADVKEVRSAYDRFGQETQKLRQDIQALAILNAAIGDYYNVDLSPGPAATKALIESVQPLFK